ncbi:MAG: ribonuclease III [Bacteroidales bacterium]|nr:ribonuclease III [Bacteroidales bacterium]
MALSEMFYHFSPEEKALSEYFHNILGFRPKNIALYQLAFTHKSKSDETVGGYHLSNERLEYLGDAVLSTAVADFLFKTYPTQPEGFLTEMRSRIVSRASLNKLSQKLGFEEYLKYTPDNSNNTSFRSIGGNAFEALVGAIYLDRGFDFTKHILIDRIIKVHIDLDQLQQTDVNFKSKLLEWSQKNKRHLVFKLLDDNTDNRRHLYHVQVFIDGQSYGEAQDFSIKGAEQLAAEKTWNMLHN